ncbi:hypothetical protein V5R04_09985 [Jonesiaceae bacterium BS-20]|uniref:Gram-positive cocci surface proteins LPxTG domain-containing protein n=1 Tax=Jonesiaceae bacterium BS-20 TaxID=3120821 RepID=A0AAU7DTE2_9MICO
MTFAIRRGVAATALLSLAFGAFAIAPASALPADQVTVTSDAFGIDDSEVGYNEWHQGSGTGFNGVAALPGTTGWLLNGKNQIFKGFSETVSGERLHGLLAGMNAEVSGAVWYQVALFINPGASDGPSQGFTTLRKQVGDADLWVSSRDIVDANGAVLVEANDVGLSAAQMAGMVNSASASFVTEGADPLEILGVGLFTDTNAADVTIKSFTVLNETVYSFGAPVNNVATEEIVPGDIADDATDYNVWHEGYNNVDAPAAEAFGEDGLMLNGQTQLLKGASEGLDGESIFTVADSIDADVTGDAWYQIPVRFGTGFTTLRQEVNGTSDKWISSKAFGPIAAGSEYTLFELNAAMSKVAQETSVDKKGVEVIGYGILVDTNAQATIASFSALNTTYNFVAASSTPTPEWAADFVKNGTPVVGNTLSVDVPNLPEGATVETIWYLTEVDTIEGLESEQGAIFGDDPADTYVPTVDDLGLYVYAAVAVFDENGDFLDSEILEFGQVTSLFEGTGVVIEGTPTVGQTLTAKATWSETPDLVEYVWFADEDIIDDAEGASLLLTADLVGKKISVLSYGEKEGVGADFQLSDETAPVAALVGDKTDKDETTTTNKNPTGEHPVTGTSLVGALAAISGLLLAGAGTFFLRRRIASQN